MRIDKTGGPPVEKPKGPSTPRRKIEIKNIENLASLDKNILNARLLEAEGGIAIRLGDDLILLKDPDAWKVETDGFISTRKMEVRTGHFYNRQIMFKQDENDN